MRKERERGGVGGVGLVGVWCGELKQKGGHTLDTLFNNIRHNVWNQGIF